MKTIKRLLSGFLAIALALGGVILPAQAAAVPSTESNPFGSNYYIEDTVQDRPFFEVVLPEIAANIKESNKNSINPYYDKFPLANNPENFQGLGSTSYANINGKTVTAEAFYRVYGDALHDPNAGMGLMIYQCIQYKLKHPEEDITISFSSYRTSVTAAVCVLPESKYYGYMRSLYTTNYDEHGFVRISYMFTEAARMGIKVVLINQLSSYDVKQYNPSTASLKSRQEIKYYTYYNKARATDCYNKYAPGKKVSDFLDCVNVGWTVSEQTSSMQHVKSCTVSHYLATDGTEHRNALFLTTSNLDEITYNGCNGNEWSQTGVIISDHEALYRTTLNYTKLMQKYSHKEGIGELRKVVIDRNKKQMALYQAGREAEIPKDEQILYLGSKTDKVFQMYFTPLGGGVDAWDPIYNPICYHIDRLVDSKSYIELAWNEFGFEYDYLGKVISKKIEKAFCENQNANNKLSIRVTDLPLGKTTSLKVGSQIGYRSIKNGKKIHAKDFLLSYEDLKGVRHHVSILTSCNYVTVAFHYRTNSMLVINETEATGGNFYSIIGEKYSGGMISRKLSIGTKEVTMQPGGTHQLLLKRANANTLKWTVSDPTVLSVDKDGKLTAKKMGTVKVTVTDGVSTATVSVNVVRCLDCHKAGKYCSKCAEVVGKGELTATLSDTSYTYDGKAKTPTVTIKNMLGDTLKKDTDYTVTYDSGRKNVGTYNVIVKMKGIYSGKKTLSFTIKPAKVSTCTVELSDSSYTYDGAVKTPAVKVKNAKGTTLKEGVDYTVTYEKGRKNAGTYDVVVTMMGNYTGKKTVSFTIKPIDISACTVKLSATKFTYTGKTKTPTVTVKNANGTTLRKGTHYTVTYEKGRKNVGTYEVTVTMKGNYSGKKVLTFKINPRATIVKKLTPGTKSLKVTVDKKVTQVTGYQIQYSTSKTFKSAVTKTLTSTSKTTLTIKSLKADKTYYVRVRTYKSVGGTRYYSAWSSYKTARTK